MTTFSRDVSVSCDTSDEFFQLLTYELEKCLLHIALVYTIIKALLFKSSLILGVLFIVWGGL